MSSRDNSTAEQKPSPSGEGGRSGTSEGTSTSLVDLLDEVVDGTEDQEEVSVDDLLKVLGQSSFGPLFAVVALLAILPTGAIPGMGILTGTLMLILSIQLLIGHDHIWLPEVLRKRAIPRDTLKSSLERARPTVKRLSRFIRPRLQMMVNPPLIQLVAAVGIIVSLTMYPLALVPFGALPAGLSLLVLGAGLSVRDGVLLIVALAIGAGAVASVYFFWPF